MEFFVFRMEIEKCSEFIRVGFDSSFCQVEPEEFSCPDPEGEFLWVKSHFAFPCLVKDALEMNGVVVVLLLFNDHVVHVYLKGVTDRSSEIFVLHLLICCSGVFESEVYYVVVIIGRSHVCTPVTC